MAIIPRVKWKVIQAGKLRDVVYFPASYSDKTVKHHLILYYGYTGSFTVEMA